MLQIRLGVDARADMSEADAWTAGQGARHLNPLRALRQDEAQIISPDGTVLAVARITGLTKCDGGDLALQGELKEGDARVGRPTTTPHRSRNPVAYVDDDSPRRQRRAR